MKKLKVILTSLLTLIASQVSYTQTIVGSTHDFSFEGWNTYEYGSGLGKNQICKICHTPHDASLVADETPLWNHQVTTSVFSLYSSSTFKGAATITQPDGSSKLCLSCHDGTVAVDNYSPVNTSSYFLLPGDPLNVGSDLSNDHPVSFDYNAALAIANPGLYPPSTTPSGLGSTIQADMLFNDKLQCASCHNPHDPVNGKFLRKSNTESTLCLTCHDK